jgi:hypothetical protein
MAAPCLFLEIQSGQHVQLGIDLAQSLRALVQEDVSLRCELGANFQVRRAVDARTEGIQRELEWPLGLVMSCV